MAFKRIFSECLDAYLRQRRKPTAANREILRVVLKSELMLTLLLVGTMLAVDWKTARDLPDYLPRLVIIVFVYLIYRVANVDTRIWRHRKELKKERKRNTKTPSQEEGML